MNIIPFPLYVVEAVDPDTDHRIEVWNGARAGRYMAFTLPAAEQKAGQLEAQGYINVCLRQIFY